MEDKIILTIGRQFGSGGREIGQRLAQELGIAYYDSELISEAARQSGLCEEVFQKADERAATGLSYAFTMGYSSFMGGAFTPYNSVLSNDGLFKLQSDAIRRLAERSCVMVGRCADYILRDDPACLSIFIHGSAESRLQRILSRQGGTEAEAYELMGKKDKQRAAYYNYYTNKTWGMAASYDLCIDASILGLEETVAYILRFIERRKALRQQRKEAERPPHFG